MCSVRNQQSIRRCHAYFDVIFLDASTQETMKQMFTITLKVKLDIPNFIIRLLIVINGEPKRAPMHDKRLATSTRLERSSLLSFFPQVLKAIPELLLDVAFVSIKVQIVGRLVVSGLFWFLRLLLLFLTLPACFVARVRIVVEGCCF